MKNYKISRNSYETAMVVVNMFCGIFTSTTAYADGKFA